MVGAEPALVQASGAAGSARAGLRARAVRLPGELVPTLSRDSGKQRLRHVSATPGETRRPLTLTLVLRRVRPAAFTRFLADLEDPASPSYHHYLSQRQLADRFGPRTGSAVGESVPLAGLSKVAVNGGVATPGPGESEAG